MYARSLFKALCLVVALVAVGDQAAFARSAKGNDSIQVDALPSDARKTLKLVEAGGPFPYERDGIVFGNRERAIPHQAHGYYHEFTVKTPSAHNRGARRIVCGGPSRSLDDCYYSDDHYQTFRKIVK